MTVLAISSRKSINLYFDASPNNKKTTKTVPWLFYLPGVNLALHSGSQDRASR